MMAISIAERSTQYREPAALGPRSFETQSTEVISSERAKELKIYEEYPEVQQLVEAQWHLMDNWVAFKIAPRFVEEIYKGQEFDTESINVTEDLVIPEYRIEQLNYLSESVAIVGTKIPETQVRMADYTERAYNLEQSVASVRNTDMSPKDELNVISWAHTAASMRENASALSTDIEKFTLSAKTKDAMFLKINDFLKTSSPDELAEKTNEILFKSRKIALEQVINMLKSEKGAINDDDEDGEIIVRGYDKRIELLEIELIALEASGTTLDRLVAASYDTAEIDVVEEESQETVGTSRQRLFGSFGLKAAKLYGVLFK